MFAAAEILVANSSRSQMNHVMDTTWLSGWPSNHPVTAKWPCGAVRTRASTNGRQRKNFRRANGEWKYADSFETLTANPKTFASIRKTAMPTAFFAPAR